MIQKVDTGFPPARSCASRSHFFPACAKLCKPLAFSFSASAGEGRSEKITLKQ